MEVTVRPDYKSLVEDLERSAFLLGACTGRWRMVSLEWPYLIITVSAAKRAGMPSEYSFRFECTGYRRTPATGRPWDVAAKQPLPFDRWPNGRSRVPGAFRTDWKNGEALYLPCDRVSLEGHPLWLSQYPTMCWSEQTGIVSYLEVIYELLNSQDYTGVRCP